MKSYGHSPISAQTREKSSIIDCKVQSIVPHNRLCGTIDCSFFSQKTSKSLLEPYKYPILIQKTGRFSITRKIVVFQ